MVKIFKRSNGKLYLEYKIGTRTIQKSTRLKDSKANRRLIEKEVIPTLERKIILGEIAGTKPKDFEFLGFKFYCGKTQNGHFKVKRKTSRKKLSQSVFKFKTWLRRYRNAMPTGELVRRAKARIIGYLNFYAVTDNTKHCDLYMHLTSGILFKWLNRRSQLKSYTWKGFKQMLSHIGWPRVRIQVNLNPFSSSPNV